MSEIFKISFKFFCFLSIFKQKTTFLSVPVRKPGINNGEIFIANSNTDSNTPPKQHPHLNHKTLSVPNLFQLAPAPTPPVAPPAVVTIKNNSAKSNSTRMVPMTPAPPIPPTSLIPVAPPPLPLPLSIPSAQNFKYLNNNQKSHIYSAPITNSTLIRGKIIFALTNNG
jgi:hypothetical protein